METLQFSLNDNQLKPINIDSLINEVLKPGSNNYQQLAYEVQREFKQGGSPDIVKMSFDRVKFNDVTGKGRFRILLDIGFTFGCEDVRVEKKNQTSEWTFAIDKTLKTITLFSSPYAENRSTADEF
ncbi:hypothetical protein ACFS5N_02230 [Mucilaginibacter ximonensis]|uniref:Uncharacterized protein n=1 Tax=Mucilaginibacter ximonensis TaxID=538021 RepID=A0ABW5Y7K3_9SPHI